MAKRRNRAQSDLQSATTNEAQASLAPEQRTSSGYSSTARLVLFFLAFGLWLWLRVDPHLVYEGHKHFPPFQTGWPFLQGFLDWPGGPVAYLAAFLSQLYWWSWAGALLLAAVAAAITVAADAIARAWGGERARVLAYGPVLVLLIPLNQHFADLKTLLGTAIAAGLAAGWMALRLQSAGARAALGLVLAVVIYYLLGGPFLLWAVLVALFELARARRVLSGLVVLLAMEAVPYLVGMVALALTAKDAFLWGLPGHPDTEPSGGYWIVVLGGVMALLGPAAAGAAHLLRRSHPRTAAPASPWRAALGTAGLVAVAAAIALTTYDGVATTTLRVTKLAEARRWEAVLREARHVPGDKVNLVIAQHTNRALFETGRLPWDMFRYPQSPASLLVDESIGKEAKLQALLMSRRNDMFFAMGDLDLRLGLVNEAEQEAHEALTVHGPHPEALRRLALVNIVKKQPEAAQVFLNALTHDLVWGTWARGALRRLAVDPGWDADPEVKRIRSVMLTADGVGLLGNPFEQRCLALLEANPTNRMAFEYLMAYYLLSRQLGGFAAQLPKMRRLNYRGIPRSYEEAILIYEAESGKRADRSGRTISSEALQDFTGFLSAASAAGVAGPQAASRALAPRFGNTYLFYYTFGASGVGER
jgi:Family of unknown function (DUF6057)